MKNILLIPIITLAFSCVDVSAANCAEAIEKGNKECIDRTPADSGTFKVSDIFYYSQTEYKVTYTLITNEYTRVLANLKPFKVGEGASLVLESTATVQQAPTVSANFSAYDTIGVTVSFSEGASTTTDVATSWIPNVDCMKYTTGFQVFTLKQTVKYEKWQTTATGEEILTSNPTHEFILPAGKEPYWKREVVL